MKIYAFAVSAFIFRNENESPVIETTFGVMFFESAASLAEECRIYAFKKWEISRGWHAHQVIISIMTNAFLEAIDEAREADDFDLSEDGEKQVFYFDDDEKPIKFDELDAEILT